MHFFVLNGELLLVSLNKQTKTTFANLRGVFMFYFMRCYIILNSDVCFDRMALGLLSVGRLDVKFLQKPYEDQPASQSLWDFHRKQGRRYFPTFSQNYTKEKKLSHQTSRCARTSYYYAMPILLCFSDVFLHFKKVFISHV